MEKLVPGSVIVHGGAGAGYAAQDAVATAAVQAVSSMKAGGDALAAAIAAVVSMEGDGRLNAGVGANLGLDGKTIEMDASVMDSEGVLGAVTCVRDVKYPVRLARAIADSSAWLLSGDGAQRFANHLGHEKHPGPSDHARARYDEIMQKLQSESPASPLADNADFFRDWNFDGPRPPMRKRVCDTVGAVVRDSEGRFAVASSTGGSAPSLLGRIGDTPIIGSGFYAGKLGAVAATGIGEEIVRHMLASLVYRWMEAGKPLEQAVKEGIALFPQEVPVGIIAISRDQEFSFSNSEMPTSMQRLS